MKSFQSGVKAILFDLDGTLMDCRQDMVIALNCMLDDLQLPHIDEAFVTLTMGKGNEYLVRQTLERSGQKHNDQTQEGAALLVHAIERYMQHYITISGVHSKVFAGVMEGLEALHKQAYAMVCLTNKPTVVARPLLAEKGLAHFFAYIFGGDAFARQKPDPLPLWRSCEILHVNPHQALMVGDSINDALAARRAGCAVALLRYGFNHGQPVEEVDADFYLDTLTELPALMGNIK